MIWMCELRDYVDFIQPNMPAEIEFVFWDILVLQCKINKFLITCCVSMQINVHNSLSFDLDYNAKHNMFYNTEAGLCMGVVLMSCLLVAHFATFSHLIDS